MRRRLAVTALFVLLVKACGGSNSEDLKVEIVEFRLEVSTFRDV